MFRVNHIELAQLHHSGGAIHSKTSALKKRLTTTCIFLVINWKGEEGGGVKATNEDLDLGGQEGGGGWERQGCL